MHNSNNNAAYNVRDKAVVFGRFVDVGGDARQFNELDRVRRRRLVGWSLVFHNCTLVCGSKRDIVLFDVSAGTLNRCGVLYEHTWTVRGVAAHGDWLASGSMDQTVRIWSMTTHEQLHCMRDHESWVQSVSFSHIGRWLVSGSADHSVIVYDATRERRYFARVTTLTLNHWVLAVCFSPDDSLLAVGAHLGCSTIYSVDAFEPLRTLAGDHWVESVAWLGDDAASLVGGTWRGELVVWYTSTGNVMGQEQVYNSFLRRRRLARWRYLAWRAGRLGHVYWQCYGSRASVQFIPATTPPRSLAVLGVQRLAEVVAGDDALAALSDEQRHRVFTAARVRNDVRVARILELIVGVLLMEVEQQQDYASSVEVVRVVDYHALMHWLRDVAPHYTHAQLAPLGPRSNTLSSTCVVS